VTVIFLFWKFSRCGFSEVLSSWRQVTKVKLAVNNVDSALNLVTGKNFLTKTNFSAKKTSMPLLPEHCSPALGNYQTVYRNLSKLPETKP